MCVLKTMCYFKKGYYVNVEWSKKSPMTLYNIYSKQPKKELNKLMILQNMGDISVNSL